MLRNWSQRIESHGRIPCPLCSEYAADNAQNVRSKKATSIIAGIMAATGAIGIAAAGNPVYADNYDDVKNQVMSLSIQSTWVNINADSAISMSVIPQSSGSLAVGKGNVKVSTNNTGYSLYISGANTDSTNNYTSLYLDGDTSNNANNAKILGLASSTATAFSDYNRWGYAVPSNSAGGYSSTSSYQNIIDNNDGASYDSGTISGLKWKGISGNYSPIINSTNPAGFNDGETTPVYFGAYVNGDIMAGTYTNNVVYTAFVDGVNNLAVSPSTFADGDTVTVTTEYYSTNSAISKDDITVQFLNGNNVVGTCPVVSVLQDGLNNQLKFTCTATKGSGSNNTNYDLKVTVRRGDNNTYAFTASGVQFKINQLSEVTYMQDVTSDICAATPLYSVSNTTYTLTDKRDNKKYLVRKLADNKCWMVQNLALAGGRTIYGPGVNGHEEDSNLPSGVSYPIPDGSGYSGKFSNNTAEHMYNGTHKDAQNDNTSDNTGAYYNWNVATAGYDTSGAKSSGNSDKSICPKGWRLPTSTDSGEFKALYTAYGSNKGNMDAAFNLTAYVGYYNSGSLGNSGSNVGWWSSTINSTTLAYRLHEYSSGYIYPSHNYNRYVGFSVRCVAQ